MAERELIAARARVEASRVDFLATVEQLQHRLKPSTLAGDAWHGMKEKSSEFSGKGMHAVAERPAAAGGALVAVLLFLLRGPLAGILTRAFTGRRRVPGTVKADIVDKNVDYDLTAPVVAANEGIKK